MIPDKVRRTIIVALARLEDTYRIKQAEVDDKVLSAGWDKKVGEVCNAQRWLDKPYSHRNGETEPPGVEGWYWYELESDDWRIVEVDNGGVYEDSFAAYYSGVEASSDVAYMRGRWYGPIPEPVQEARHDDDA